MNKILFKFLVFILFLVTYGNAFGNWDEEVCKFNYLPNSSNIIFSKSGSSYAYSKIEDGVIKLYKNGKKIGKDYVYTSTGKYFNTFKFGSNGKSFSYYIFDNVSTSTDLYKDGKKIGNDDILISDYGYIANSDDIYYIYILKSDYLDSTINKSKLLSYLNINNNTFTGYNISSPVYSKNGNHYYFDYYEDKNKENSKYNIDGKIIEGVKLIKFESDGNTIDYVIEKDGLQYFVQNGVISNKGYNSIFRIFYSSGANNYSYQTIDFFGNYNIVKDGKLLGVDNSSISTFVFSKDLSSYAYLEINDSLKTEKLIQDGNVILDSGLGDFDKIHRFGFYGDGNGNNFYYIYIKDNILHIVDKGVEVAGDGLGIDDRFLYNNYTDYNSLYYLHKIEDKIYPNINNVKSVIGFDNINSYGISADNNSFYFIGNNNGNVSLVKDNFEIGSGFLDFTNVKYSQDSENKLSYIGHGQDGKYYFFRNEIFIGSGTLGSSTGSNNAVKLLVNNSRVRFNYSSDGKYIYSYYNSNDNFFNTNLIIECKSKYYIIFEILEFILKYGFIFIGFILLLLLGYGAKVIYVIKKYDL